MFDLSARSLSDAEKGWSGSGACFRTSAATVLADVNVFAEGGVGGLVFGEDLGHGGDVGGVEFVEFAMYSRISSIWAR